MRQCKNNLRSFIISCHLSVFIPKHSFLKPSHKTCCQQGRPDCCASVHRSQSLSMRRSTNPRNSINASSWWVLQDWHGNQQCSRLSCTLTSSHRETHHHPVKLSEEGTECFLATDRNTYGSTKKKTKQNSKTRHPHKSIFKMNRTQH